MEGTKKFPAAYFRYVTQQNQNIIMHSKKWQCNLHGHTLLHTKQTCSCACHEGA